MASSPIAEDTDRFPSMQSPSLLQGRLGTSPVLPAILPPEKAHELPITMVQSRGISRQLAHYLVHSMRCLGHLPALALALRLRTRRTLAALMLYALLRQTDRWNAAVHNFIRFGSSNRPRFIQAQRKPYDCSKQFLISQHPHGVLLCPLFTWLGREEVPSASNPADKGFSTGMKAMNGLVVNLCFAPAVQFYTLHGEMYRDKVTDVSASTIRGILRRTRDRAVKESVCVCPGGFSEAVYSGYSDKHEVSFIKGRYGFIKIAIEEGIDIIPAYSFGAQDMYWGADWKRHERARLAQQTGLPLLAWSGKYGTNVPFNEDTVTVTFDPFPTSAYRPDQVEQAHADYCRYLKACFDAYKGCCESTRNKELLFIGKDSPPQVSPAKLYSAL